MYIQYIDSSFVICVTKASHYGISFEIWHMLQDCVFCGKAIETFKNLFFFIVVSLTTMEQDMLLAGIQKENWQLRI